MDRRQNNGSVKAVSPRHCPATCALRNCCFNCGQSQRQRPLMNNLGNSKQKGSKTAQLHLPTHDLFWANLRVQLHLPSLRSLDLLISPGTLTLAFESGYNYSLLLLCATDSLLVTETKQRSRTLRWLPTPNKDHALSAGYRNQTKIAHSPQAFVCRLCTQTPSTGLQHPSFRKVPKSDARSGLCTL